MAERTKATVLKTVVLRTPVNEWLDPMKEAPSNEGLLLFQRDPHREGIGGGVLKGYGDRQPEREGYRAASEYVVAEALAVSLDKPLEWAVGFFFGNVELSLELWTVIAGILGFDD